MRAGELDRRITIQRPVTREDPLYGPQPGGWENFAERVPARVRDVLPSNAEAIQGGLASAARPAQVRIRYMRGISTDMRVIVHREVDELYQIKGGPAEIGRGEWTEFTIEAYTT